ncbi:unnamed protein product [Mytilus edulis]|uniref:Homeobox domain-containing protein n=1 Tax=Mytilus edulis TaxID=6550 RepID=A0A8S3U679_MYTED|nr:unnamed protein product [Mytilus edulis]
MSQKKKRSDFLEGEKEILEVAYEGGIKKNTSKNCQDAIKSVAERLSCSEDRVKMWIGNRNSKVKGPGGAKIPPMTRYTRGPSAYNIIANTVERVTKAGVQVTVFVSKFDVNFETAIAESIHQSPTETAESRKNTMEQTLNMSMQSINSALTDNDNDVNVVATVMDKSNSEIVDVRETPINKCTSTVADNTQQMELTLWKHHIDKVVVGKTYHFTNLSTRFFHTYTSSTDINDHEDLLVIADNQEE